MDRLSARFIFDIVLGSKQMLYVLFPFFSFLSFSFSFVFLYFHGIQSKEKDKK